MSFQTNCSLVKIVISFSLVDIIINFMSNAMQKQIETINLIKQLAKQLQQEEQQEQDSLMVSESQPSVDTIQISIKQQIKPQKRKKKAKKYHTKYVSPYKQHQISIDKIQATGRRRINPKISFSNTVLQMVTSDAKPHTRNSPQYSRYRNCPSILQKIQQSALDRLRTQARQMYQIQQKLRKEIPPQKRNQMWADFLLRERRWQQQKKAKYVESKQESLLNQRKADKLRPKEPVKEVQGITRENLIRKIRREKGKLQEQLKSISRQSYQWRHVNIRGERSVLKPQSNRVRVSHSKEANFLIDYP